MTPCPSDNSVRLVIEIFFLPCGHPATAFLHDLPIIPCQREIFAFRTFCLYFHKNLHRLCDMLSDYDYHKRLNK